MKWTQFLFPDARRVTAEIIRPEPIEAKARELQEAGFLFEIENKYGDVWITIRHPMNWVTRKSYAEQTFDTFCKNGPEVPAAIDALIERAYAKLLPGGGAGKGAREP